MKSLLDRITGHDEEADQCSSQCHGGEPEHPVSALVKPHESVQPSGERRFPAGVHRVQHVACREIVGADAQGHDETDQGEDQCVGAGEWVDFSDEETEEDC